MQIISSKLMFSTLLFFILLILSIEHSSSLKFIFVQVTPAVQIQNASLLQIADSTSNIDSDDKKSDAFYYILGITILIVAAILFKKRYEQYLHDKDKLNS